MTTALRNIPEPQRFAIASKRANSETKGIGQQGAKDYLEQAARKAKQEKKS